MSSISVIVLTYNEELHLDRCLQSLRRINANIYVIDSYSTDQTEQIAKKYGAYFLQHAWKNHANQINWAIDNCKFNTDWVMRVDADEYLSDGLIESINTNLDKLPLEVNGIRVKRLMYFMDKPLKKGGMYPIWHLKIWRKGNARCEQKWMDERMVISHGEISSLEGDLIDYNLNNITWWTAKHNGYATLEAIDILDKLYGITYNIPNKGKFFGKSEERRRWLKMKYLNMPLFVRPFIFFFIRYFMQLGLLEGKRGFVWSILQCFWYRFLVDAKIDEIISNAGKNKGEIITYLRKVYNINFD